MTACKGITDFTEDLGYFLCNSDIQVKGMGYEKSKEKRLNIVNTYDESCVLNIDNYVSETPSYVDAKITIRDKWLDIGIRPHYNNDYDEIFTDDIGKYKVFLFVYVLKKNMAEYWICDENENLCGIDTEKMELRYKEFDNYFKNKYIEENISLQSPCNKNTDVNKMLENFDNLYDRAHPIIKRVPKPQTIADKEMNKLYNNRKTHKSQSRKELIKYLNGCTDVENSNYIELLAFSLRNMTV